VIRLLFAALLGGCAVTPVATQNCTAIGCASGVNVDFTFRDKGTYVIEVMLDGVKTTCRAVLPLSDPPPSPCDRDGVILTLSGSKLPPEQQSIGGIFIASTTAKQLIVKATRDGTPIGSLDRTIDYKVSPGPNGPNCEPKECKQASMTLG
jgi:hypothetical protein